MTNAKTIDQWKLPEIESLINELDDVFDKQSTVTKIADDFPFAVVQTTAKAILNMREVIVLLKNGYPDGALSRGRNLFEQAAILTFLKKHSNDNEIIRRYHDDYEVKRLDNLIKIHQFFLQEDKERIPGVKNRLEELQQEYDKLRTLYGVAEKYFDQYWWAKPINKKRPTFGRISADGDFGILKILYNRACISTHSSAMGEAALLGRSNQDGSMLFTGPTYQGFEAPIILALGSFGLIISIAFDVINHHDESLNREIHDIISPLLPTLL